MKRLKNNLKNLSLLVPGAMLVTGCGMIRNLSEMHDNTKEMNATTSGMANTTAGMAKTTNDMAKTTNDMATTTNGMAKTTAGMAVTTESMAKYVTVTYDDLRLGNTRQARQEALEAIKTSEEMPAKMGYASEYFAAMEYQFWKPELETEEKRQAMMMTAVKDFFRKVKEYISNYDMVAPTATDPQTENLYSLAAALHYVNPAQDEALRGKDNIQTVTMLSMIEDGLRAKRDLETGVTTVDSVPAYQLEVLRQEQAAVYLLRVRQNFLKAFAFVSAASQESGNDPQKWKSIWDWIKGKFGGNWVPNFAVRNAAQVDYNAIVLDYAAETLNMLNSMGYDPKSDGKIKTLLQSMNVDAVDPGKSAAKKAAIAHVRKALKAALVDDVAGNLFFD